MTLPEHETLTEMTPILYVSVWDHAYMYDYQDRRKKYLKNLWRIIDWSVVEQRYLATN